MSTVLTPPSVQSSTASRPQRQGVAQKVTGRTRRRALDGTRAALEAAAGDGAVHAWVEDLVVEDAVADHLVLNPAGAFVVVSVWHGPRLTGASMHGHAVDALAAAARTRSELRSRDIQVGVRAVIAVWGAGSVDVPAGGVEHDGLLYISGGELTQFLAWSASCGGTRTHQQATDLLLDLRDLQAAERVVVPTR